MSYYYDHYEEHYVCNLCEEAFDYVPEFFEHREEEHAHCQVCSRWFVSERALSHHKRDSVRHNLCNVCGRDFSTPAQLRGHEQVHFPRTMKCPAGCPKEFATASALAKHIEVSNCCGKLTPSVLARKVREWEAKSGNRNLLTAPRIGWSGPETTVITTYHATEAAWNGWSYECYVCPKQCSTLASLNQHLNSGAHEAKEFRCKKCGFTAIWLSGLIAHVESEKCGFMSREQVHRFVRQPFEQLRLGN